MLINNRYNIQKSLGRGGFGQTYLAFDTQCFDHPCVLKEFAPASRAEYAMQKARELFEREARTLYEINHPQIPKFLAWFVAQKRLFLVQEYISGKTYTQLIRERQQQGYAFSELEVMQWLMDLLPVLSYLHERQMVHRDISPDNIMLPDYPGAKPVLIDFGLVKQTLSKIYAQSGDQPLEAGSFVGKFGYAPPEQIRMGYCSPSSDLYALGVTTLVLLTGKEPRSLIDQSSLEWHWREDVEVSDRLAQVLTRMLHEQPRSRYQTTAAVLHDLTALPAAAPYPIPHPPYSHSYTPPVPQPRPTVNSTPVAYSGTDADFLHRCQQALTSCIGPIADFVLENTLAQQPHATATELIDALALEIPDPAQAKALKATLTQLVQPAKVNPGLRQSGQIKPSEPSASRSDQAHSTAAISPDFLDRCQTALTRCIGPVASLILEDILQTPQLTPQHLIEAIVAEIPDLRQAQAFQKLMESI